MYKVYLADDEIWVIVGIKKLIEKTGAPFQVIGEANNGVMALEEIEQKKPDVLITDIRMPGMNGLQLLEQIREKNLDMKIVFISGYAEFEYAQKATRLGAFDYLLKPVETEELSLLLERLEQELEANGRRTQEQEEEEVNLTIMESIINEIQGNYTKDVTLTDLAERYNISTGHLSSLLKKRLGLPFSEYVSSKRIQKAKELLADEHFSIDAIAQEVGYKDYFYFTKVFKKIVGISPSKYRKNL